MASALYNLCRKDGTVMVYSITGPEVAAAIGCKLQDAKFSLPEAVSLLGDLRIKLL